MTSRSPVSDSDAELNADWQQTLLEHQQAGVTIQLALAEPAEDPEPKAHDECLDEYERG
jgi:hypothetical protein